MKVSFIVLATLLVLAASQCQDDIKGCVTCSFKDVCTACNPTDGFVVTPATATSCVCDSGFFDDGQLSYCQLCSLKYPDCATCTNSVCSTCIANSNTSLNAGNTACINPCQTSSGVVGCATCTGATCNSCSDTRNLTLSGTACVCKTGFVKEKVADTFCVPCNWNFRGCLTCSNIATCTACDTANNFQLNANGSCVCKGGFYQVISTNWSIVASCVACTLANCSVCSNATTCTTCATGFTTVVSGSTTSCQACSVTLPGCLVCNNTAVCTNCSTSGNFVGNGTRCQCSSNFFLNGQNVCEACTSFGSECRTCLSTGCLTCSDDFVLNTTGTGAGCKRECNITGCINCFNTTTCALCTPFASVSQSLGICLCDSGYVFSGNTCVAVAESVLKFTLIFFAVLLSIILM